MSKVIYLIVLSIFLFSCRGQTQKSRSEQYDPEAVRLNNRAMEIFHLYYKYEDSLAKADSLLAEAIKKDKFYYLPYSNKAELYCFFQKYDLAIVTLNEILDLNPDLITLKEFKAFMLEKSGDLNSAVDLYNEIVNDYDKRIKIDSKNTTLKLNRAFILFFTEGHDKANQEFSKIFISNPNDKDVEQMTEIFKTFNRKKFIDLLCIRGKESD